MTLMLIIADDLTGAADCGVTCAGRGLATIVALGDSGGDVNAEVLSVDGDTRRLAPDEAAVETARLLRRYLGDEETLVYKKLDSTLRGNVGAEMAAILEARRTLTRTHERVVAVLAPAFPATGRTTVNGRQLVNGEPLDEIEVGDGARERSTSDISTILRKAHLRPALLGLELVRGDCDTLQNAMRTIAEDADVLVCDAETEGDLRCIAEASIALGRGTVWAGSAGLARHLPLAAGLARGPISKEQPLAAGPALFVIGSGSEVSREQVEVLGSESDTIVMRIPTEVMMAGEHSAEWRAFGVEMGHALNAGSDVAVLLEPGVRLDGALRPQLTAALGTMVRPFTKRVGALVATGGETARAVFEAWGVTRLRLIGEVEAGVPFSVTSGWRRELPVITKAGGFGGRETLLRCGQFLNGLKRGEASSLVHDKGRE